MIPAGLGVLVYFTHSNTLSIWYSISMLVWGITFTEMWKRKQMELAVQWGVLNCSKHEKQMSAFKGDKTVPDQITGEERPFVPAWKIILRRALTLPAVALGAAFLMVIVGLVFVLQLFLHEYYTGPFQKFLVSELVTNGQLPMIVCLLIMDCLALRPHYWLCPFDSNHVWYI
jgi:hypothetical protein